MDLTKPSPFGDHSPVLDKENPFESMMKRLDIAAFIVAIDKVARTLKIRGIYA